MREYLHRYRSHIRVERLPGYAPNFNPVEQVRSHAKYSDLANATPSDIEELGTRVGASLVHQRGQSHLLRSFFQTAKLRL